jgi:hypothetical protein
MSNVPAFEYLNIPSVVRECNPFSALSLEGGTALVIWRKHFVLRHARVKTRCLKNSYVLECQ